jgi:serine phosphatase RsbU (regulator of sigma subunit)
MAIGNDFYDETFKFQTKVFQLEKNDMIYCFSDGFQDQFGGPKGKKYKVEPLKELLIQIANLPAAEQRKKLETELASWMDGFAQVDDITAMGIRI